MRLPRVAGSGRPTAMRIADRIPALRPRAERWVDRRLPGRVPFSPSYIQLEVANRCNFACVMCPIVELSGARRKKLLTAGEFAAIAGQFPALARVDLQGIGEPTLNPELEGMIAWCAERGIEVGFVTNGVLLDDARIASLIDAGLTHVVFSMDSVDPGIFARIRRNGKLDVLLDRIARTVAYRRSEGLKRPSIGIMAIAMKDNLQGLPEVVEKAHDLAVDAITIKGLNTATKADQKPEDVAAVVAQIEGLSTPGLGVTIAASNDRSELHCRWPWSAAYITVEGDVTPCCNCPDARVLTFGNLLERPFLELWNAGPYRAFRRELRDAMPSICTTCPDY